MGNSQRYAFKSLVCGRVVYLSFKGDAVPQQEGNREQICLREWSSTGRTPEDWIRDSSKDIVLQ